MKRIVPFHDRLWLYVYLSQFRWLKNYTSKILLVAFIGTHVPLLTLLICFVFSTTFTLDAKINVLVIALLATLIGTGATLFALHCLLTPVAHTSLALRRYQLDRQLPNLPTAFADEVGTLMADTSQTLRKLDEVIHYMANYDVLTGLPNLVLFRDRLQQVLMQTQPPQIVAVLAFGLNNFQDIYNTLGHQCGEQVLRTVAQQLERCISEKGVVCRSGNDEFLVLQTMDTIAEAVNLSQTLLDSVSKPFSLSSTQIRTSASVGITLSPLDSSSVDTLLGNAGSAMSAAKQHADKRYQFYSTQIGAQLQERLRLEADLHHALERSQLFLHYQPQVSAITEQIVGVEALLRWQHPDFGLISPAKFVAIAEANGLILPIGEWVLHTACVQSMAWRKAGLPPVSMAVNLSPLQFKQASLVDRITQILETTGLPAPALKLEITESLVMDEIQTAVNVLRRLHEVGVSIALDDFGSSYSSLNYLAQLPIDTLKIDQSFIRNLENSTQDATITRIILSLAHSLNLNVVAEGVETQAQLDFLRANGCHEIQGYFYSRPVSANEIAQKLRKVSRVS